MQALFILAASDEFSFKYVSAAVALISALAALVVAKRMRGTTMKKWARAKGLDYAAGMIVGEHFGYGLEVTMTDHRIDKEQMKFDGTCRLRLRNWLPDQFQLFARANPHARVANEVQFPHDPEFNQAALVSAADPSEARQLLKDPGLRQIILHFLRIDHGLEVNGNLVSTSVSGIAVIGGDPSHVLDTPLRRCLHLADALETALAGDAVDVNMVPGLRAGGGLARGPLKAKSLPSRRQD